MNIVNGITTMSATLKPGNNLLLIEAYNLYSQTPYSNPAGLIVGVYLNGNLIFKTGVYVCVCVYSRCKLEKVVIFSKIFILFINI